MRSRRRFKMYKKKSYFTSRVRIKSHFIFFQDDINKITNSFSVYDVIKDFVVLRRSGKDYVGRCPFCRHGIDNDFHFRVSVRLSKYKCFECGAGGTNGVSFLMRYFNRPFDYVIMHIVNGKYSRKVDLRIKGIVAVKKKGNRGEDLPF